MALHEVQLKGYSVRPSNLSLGTFDSYGIEQLHITLDDTWSGLAVTATFNPPEGEPVEIRVPENGLIDVRAEATANEGTGTIVYCGVANGVQRISKTQGYIVSTHGNVGTTVPFNPSESLATQVLQAALSAEQSSAEAKSVANDLRVDAANGKFNGKDGAKGDKGETGTTPQLKIGEDNLWHVSYDNGATWVSLGVKATGDTGAAGKDGVDGLTPHIGGNGNWWIGDTDTGVLAKGKKGDTGAKGADGVSPTASVTQTDDGAKFTVTDASGTTTAVVKNGVDGKNGAPGANGVSPTVQVKTIDGGHRVTLTDASGAHAVDVLDGKPGKDAVVDATLTQDGQAADAKKTGEAISQLKEDLSKSVNGIELSKNLLDNSSVITNKRPSNWAGQTIYDSYKTDGYHTFKAIPVTQNNTYYFVENGDLVNFGQLATYDKDGKYVSLLSPSTLNVNGVNVGYIIPENIAYVRGESKTSNFSNVNFKLFNGRFEKKFLKYNESAYEKKNLPVVVFDFDQVVEIDARFAILKKYGFVGNVVEVATNNYEITKKLIRMGYDISPYLGNHTWDYSTEDGIQKLTANIAEKLGGLEAIGVYNPTMISCSGHKYSDTMEKILSSYKIDYVRCSGFIKDGVSLKKSIYENSYDTRIVVPIGLGSYNGVDEFNGVLDTLVDGNVPLIMPFMHTFTYDADWITEDAFEKIVSHVSDLVKNGKALCMNMHDFVAYNDTVKSIHDDYVRNMSAIFN